MCKYCEQKVSKLGEADNGIPEILRMTDGHQIMTVSFRNYTENINDKTSARYKELYMELGFKDYEGHETYVKTATRKIKYCPFCGEKL